MIAIIQKILQIQEIDSPHIDILFLSHFQFHDHVSFIGLDIVMVEETSTTTEPNRFRDTLNFTNKEEFLDLHFTLLSETIISVLLVVPILKIDKINK